MWQQPLGQVAQQQQIDSTWRLEGLVVLAWALGRFAIPPHDQLVEFNSLWASLCFLNSPTARTLLANQTLRSRKEIGALRNRLFALHWRLRNYYLNPKVMDFAGFARTCRFGPLDISGVPLVDGDLGLGGERIDRASPNLFSSAHCAAQERHRAANWLWLSVWGLAAAGVVALVVLARRRLGARRAWLAPLAALPVALVVLFFLFGAVNTLLPASF